MTIGRGARVLAAGVAVCALTTACTTGASPDADPSPSPVASPSSSAPPEPVTITFAVYGPRPSLDGYRQLAEAFTALNPHVTVETENLSSVEEVISAVEGGDPPDVFLMDHDHLPRLVEEGRVQPVDGLLEERAVDFGDGFQRAGLTAFAAEAALQCMPHDVSPLVVYYNKQLVDLDRLAAPGETPPSPLEGWDWETFAAAARRAAQGAANGFHVDPSLESLAPFVWSAGAEIVDDEEEPTTLTLSDEDARDALEQVLALARDPQVTPSSSQLAKQDAVTRFANGRLGMILGTRALTPRFRETTRLDFDVMPLPSLGRFGTVTDMTGYCLAKDTDQLDTAADFLAFAVGREGASITARPGYVVPSNLEVANSPVFTQPALPPASSFVFNDGVRRSQPMPFEARWPELEQRIGPALQRMFYAPVIDLDALLEEIDATSTEVLAQPEQ